MNIIWSENINLIQILWGLKNHPNTNTNIIRFEKGDRIRIRILFSLKKATEYKYEYYLVWKKSLKYEYEYYYSASTIWMIFEYQIIRSPLALKPVKAHYCVQRQNIKEYKRTIYFQKVQTGCIFLWSPPKKFQVLWSGW